MTTEKDLPKEMPAPSKSDKDELSDKALDEVSGGFNPQPDLPTWHPPIHF